MSFAIQTKKLTKCFGELAAVRSINVAVHEGEIFGLLGPNGAGKTTFLSMLCTLLKPTEGKATVNGFDVERQSDEVRKSIGVVFQDESVDEELTGWENLDLHGRLYGMSVPQRENRIAELFQLIGLTERKDDAVRTYSGGMIRRLEIARGLMNHPRVLFLDEPTLGLDPQTRRHIWEYVKKLNQLEDVTIVLTTHYMEEADILCDRVAIIDRGRVVALDAPEKLKKHAKKRTLEEVFINLTGSHLRQEYASRTERFKTHSRVLGRRR